MKIVITLIFLVITNLSMGDVIEHPPYTAGDCLKCHKAGDDGKPIKNAFIANQPDLCYACHERKDVKKSTQTVVHEALKKKCTMCHAPHKSEFKPLLKSAQPDLCYNCHDRKDEPTSDHTLVHPALKKDCTVCHAVHSAEVKPLLKLSQPDLCYGCHAKKDDKKVVHPPIKKKCTSCHVPHKSDYKPLLKNNIQVTCSSCHDAPGGELPNRHLALDMVNGCVRCHDPHSSPNEKMLKDKTKVLCVYCHTDIGDGLKNKDNTIHKAVNLGCQKCHAPHGSENDKLLKSNPNELCFTCHEKAHFDGGHPRPGHPISGRPDPLYSDRELSCISCHKPHFSPNERLLRYNFKVLPYNGTVCSVCHWQQLMGPPGPPRPDWD